MKQYFPIAALALWAISLAGAEVARPDLSGLVLDEMRSPVTNATVFVYTAGPRTGAGLVCPSCYPDCGKQVRTSSTGRYLIPSLDPDLVFRLLALAPGFEPCLVDNVDPAHGERKIILSRLSEARLKSPNRMLGLVMDPSGKPLARATLSPEGVDLGTMQRWGGNAGNVDPLTVTDENGRFRLNCATNIQRVFALLEGRGVAKRWVELTPGRDHLFLTQEGVLVSGRVLHQGQPVKGAVLGMMTRDRQAGVALRCDPIATDNNGYFLFANVPPQKQMVLFAKMGSLPEDGTLENKTFTTGATGSRLEAGTLEVKPGCRVAGRVVLPHEDPIPAQSRILLSREDAWYSAETALDAEGRFEFRAVPRESVRLTINLPGYKTSKKNASLNWLSGGLIGRVDGDIPELRILMEPGEWRYNRGEGEPPNGDGYPRDQPLRGFEERK